MKIRHVDPENGAETVIRVEGMTREVRLVHVTDSHLVETDERNPEVAELVERSRQRYQELNPRGALPREELEETLAAADGMDADAVALTGDITHFPTALGLEILEERLRGLRGTILYTTGNHDWYFPHLEWCESTRSAYYPKFRRLMGENPACQVEDLGELLLVGLDNSNYQVDVAQVAFLRQHLATGRPCLLCMHIPLYVPSLAPSVVERWTSPIMMAAEGWTEEGRVRWMVREDDVSTRECYELLTSGNAENLVGILCGHVHFGHADEFADGRFQYVTGTGFEGTYRVVRIEPYG